MPASKTSRLRSNRRLRSMMPGLEPLEGRRLLSTIATTLDANKNPVIFSIASNGSVTVDREVPTNDSADPYRPNGLQTLYGVTATSLAAYQAADGSPVVLATTGADSYIYADSYSPTGNPAQPFAWTGFKPIGTFVASSIVAVSATNASGPAIFAIGADSNVYEDLFTGSAATGSFSGFQRLPGLTATTLAATHDGGGSFRVFALTGPESYVYQDVSTNVGTTISSSGWSAVDTNFVANSISVTSGPANATVGGITPDTLVLFATGTGDGYLYDDSLVLNSLTGERTDGGFQAIGSQPAAFGYSGVLVSFVASSVVNSGDYLTVFTKTTNGIIYTDEAILTGLTDPTLNWVGWKTIDYPDVPSYQNDALTALQFATITGVGGGVEIVADGFYFSTAPSHAALSSPDGTPIDNVFSAPTPLSDSAYHPIVATVGVNGAPVLFTLGSDGQIYESEDQDSGDPRPYSDFANLPGINATSLAVTTEPDGIALFALTAGSSLISENQYRPTGVGSAYAWSGWVTLHGFVATSIAAATGGDSASNGPTLFATGLNGNVYEAGSTAPATSSGPYTFSNFSVLSGLASPLISVRSTTTGIEVAGLAGPESDPYVDLDTSGTFSGWQVTGEYVASSILATTSADGGPAVAATSPLGYQAVSDDAGTSGWTAYQPIFFQGSADGTTTLFDGFASQTMPSQAGVFYYDLIQFLYASPYNSIYPAYSLGSGTSTLGESSFSYTGINSIAAAPDALAPTFYVGGYQDGMNGISVFTEITVSGAEQPFAFYETQTIEDLPS